MTATNKDVVLVVSLVLSLVSLVLLFGVTWYFQSSLDLLQQQVEYDRELLLKLQEQVNAKLQNDLDTVNIHDVTKRQSGDQCQCKDGTPGPRGPPGPNGDEGKQGRKGDVGPPGPRGDTGDRGPRGVIGDPGYRGSQGGKGDQGDRGKKGSSGVTGLTGTKGDTGTKGKEGDTGPRGDPGDRGRRGLIGETGSPGPAGETGEPGMKGVKGDQGDQGDQGLQRETGGKGESGLKGEMGHQGMKGNKGEKGSSGLPGSTGLTGSKGATGQKGVKGDKEERNGGTVYVRWGHDQCPPTAQLVYSGRAGGSWYDHGGGANPQCLPMDPNYLSPINSGSDQTLRALMYGAEYQTHTESNSNLHGRHDRDVPCAVCYVTQRSTVYMVPAKYTCPSGWTREYFGYLMADRYTRKLRTQFTCIDYAFKSVPGSEANQNGMVFYFTEGRCGSLPCPPYDNTKELSCAVCTN